MCVLIVVLSVGCVCDEYKIMIINDLNVVNGDNGVYDEDMMLNVRC